MDKFGVDETNAKTAKTASDGERKCPECGEVLKQHGNVLLCPTHGSKPFEDTDDKR